MATGVQKAIKRLEEGLQSGDAYEAQQVLKTAYYRLRARQQLQDSYDLLQTAATMQFRHNQFTCGLELAKLLIEAYQSDEVGATDDALGRIQAMLTVLPHVPSSDATSQAALVDGVLSWADSAIAWAARRGAPPAQQQDLHTLVADWLYGERGWKALAPVSTHYACGLSVDGLHTVLSDSFDPTKAREWDLFVTRAVLQLLAAAPALPQRQQADSSANAQRLRLAASAAKELQSDHLEAARQLLDRCQPDASQPEFAGVEGHPLLGFCSLLVEALEKRSQPLTAALRQHYEPALQRDPDLGELLDRMEAVFLGRRPAADGMGNMLGSLMQMLGGGADGG